jgi:tRNA(fMet)-specific endonuclease VapC
MAGYLLDTNIVILVLRSRPEALDFLSQSLERGDELYISVITYAEVLAGMHPHEEKHTLALLDTLTGVDVDQEIAGQAGRWIYQYARQGMGISFPDAMIAATAAARNLRLVTFNGKHFPMLDTSRLAINTFSQD